jgi:sulfonate transport system ATP-binding protein
VLSKRPAKVKLIVNVDLPRPRDRTSYEFSTLKKKIYAEFFGKLNNLIEYMI